MILLFSFIFSLLSFSVLSRHNRRVWYNKEWVWKNDCQKTSRYRTWLEKLRQYKSIAILLHIYRHTMKRFFWSTPYATGTRPFILNDHQSHLFKFVFPIKIGSFALYPRHRICLRYALFSLSNMFALIEDIHTNELYVHHPLCDLHSRFLLFHRVDEIII